MQPNFKRFAVLLFCFYFLLVFTKIHCVYETKGILFLKIKPFLALIDAASFFWWRLCQKKIQRKAGSWLLKNIIYGCI